MLVLVLAYCGAAESMYSCTYPDKPQPVRSVYRRLVNKLKEHGSFKKPL